jgi:ankyrin repeat protein
MQERKMPQRNVQTVKPISRMDILPSEKPALSALEQGQINYSLLDAAKRGDIAEIKELLKNGADINAKNNDGETALMQAVIFWHKDVCALLLEKGADMEAKDKVGWTPLTRAISYGNADAIKLLLDSGARNIKAALRFASFDMRLEILKWTDNKLLAIIGSEADARKFRSPFYACAGKA